MANGTGLNGNVKWIIPLIITTLLALMGWGKDLAGLVHDSDTGKINENKESVQSLWKSQSEIKDRVASVEVHAASATTERRAINEKLDRIEVQSDKTLQKVEELQRAIYRIEAKLE